MRSKIVVVEAARTFGSRHPEPMRLDVIERGERYQTAIFYPAYDENSWRSLALLFSLDKPALRTYLAHGAFPA